MYNMSVIYLIYHVMCGNIHLCRIVSSLDRIASILGPGLAPGETLRPRDDTFEMEISQVEVSAISSFGYTVDFIQNNVDEAILPASLFTSRGGNVLISTSLISQTAVFRGKDKTLNFASRIISTSVVGEANTVIDSPVTVTFEKTADVSFKVN